jgi:hypothetical protein
MLSSKFSKCANKLHKIRVNISKFYWLALQNLHLIGKYLNLILLDGNMKTSGPVIFAVVMIVLFFVFLSVSFGSSNYLEMLGSKGEYRLCSEYLQNGTIFQGQPYCGQGITTYAFVFVLRMLSGGTISNMLYLFVMLLLTLHALFLLLRIIQKETGKREYFLTGILYFLTVYIFCGGLPSFLTAYFCIIGFYVLWHSTLKFRNILGPVLYACALLSKPTALPIVAFLVGHMVYRAFQPCFESKKLVFNNDWQSAGIRLLSFGAVLALVFLLFPGSWVYEFGNQATYLQGSVLMQLQQLLGSLALNSGTMFFGLILLLSFIAWIFLRDVYSSLVIFSFVVLFWIFYNTGVAATSNGLLFATSRIDYYSATFPFFIVAMAKLKHRIDRLVKWNWIVGILLALFLATSIGFVFADRDVRLLDEKFKNALSLIPYQNDYVLMEDPLSDQLLLDKYYDPKVRIDVITHNTTWKEGVFPDSYFYRKLEEMHVTNISEWMIEVPSEEYITPYSKTHNLFFSRLLNNSYTFIFVNVMQKTLITQMIRNATNLKNYCTIILPDLQFHTPQGAHGLLLMFRDKTRCMPLLRKVKDYYAASFADICARSPVVANQVIKTVLSQQGISFPKCKESVADSLLFLNQRSARLRMFWLILGALLAWFAWVEDIPGIRSHARYKMSKGQKNKGRSKNR